MERTGNTLLIRDYCRGYVHSSEHYSPLETIKINNEWLEWLKNRRARRKTGFFCLLTTIHEQDDIYNNNNIFFIMIIIRTDVRASISIGTYIYILLGIFFLLKKNKNRPVIVIPFSLSTSVNPKRCV